MVQGTLEGSGEKNSAPAFLNMSFDVRALHYMVRGSNVSPTLTSKSVGSVSEC